MNRYATIRLQVKIYCNPFSFSHLGFWTGDFFLIAPFPDHCLLSPFCTSKKLKLDDQTSITTFPLSSVSSRLDSISIEPFRGTDLYISIQVKFDTFYEYKGALPLADSYNISRSTYQLTHVYRL